MEHDTDLASSSAWAYDIAVALKKGYAAAKVIEAFVKRIMAASRLDQAVVMHKLAKDAGATAGVLAELDKQLQVRLDASFRAREGAPSAPPTPQGPEDLLSPPPGSKPSRKLALASGKLRGRKASGRARA